MEIIKINKLSEFSEWFMMMEDVNDCFMMTDGFIAPMKYPCEISYEVIDEANGTHQKTCNYKIDNVVKDNVSPVSQ